VRPPGDSTRGEASASRARLRFRWSDRDDNDFANGYSLYTHGPLHGIIEIDWIALVRQ